MTNGRRMNKKNNVYLKKRQWIPLLLLAIIVGLVAYIVEKVTAYESVDLTLSDEELGITEDNPSIAVSTKSDKIFHMALFGLDRRDSEDQHSRSDAMIIATLDFKHDKVKLTSLMRDQLVDIEGHGLDKLNHAYAYGGAPLALKTINQNFGTDIRNYATVDFFMLEDIINAIGGVTVPINEEERLELNKQLRSVRKPLIKQEGEVHMDGQTAVAYSRIRYVGDGDFERTERQRRVLQAMVVKAKEAGPYGMAKLWMTIAPYVETSLSTDEILTLGRDYYTNEKMEWEQARFPLDGTWRDGRHHGSWVMEVDLEAQKRVIQDYLYRDLPPKGMETVFKEPLLLERFGSY